MDIKLTKQDAEEFQEFLTGKFGVMASHFGLDYAIPPGDDIITLPRDKGWMFLIESWEYNRGEKHTEVH